MTIAGLPTPPGFTITTEACNDYFAAGEQLPGRPLGRRPRGGARRSRSAPARASATRPNPLLVSVRSGAKFSMPGMMDTVLNLGLNEETLHGLIALTGNERFGWDAYRRFIAMFGRIVMEVPPRVVTTPTVDGRVQPLRRRARRGQARPRREVGHGPRHRRAPGARQAVQGDRPRADRSRLPDRRLRAARPRDQGRLRLAGSASGPTTTATTRRSPTTSARRSTS